MARFIIAFTDFENIDIMQVMISADSLEEAEKKAFECATGEPFPKDTNFTPFALAHDLNSTFNIFRLPDEIS
jgi:hypothetical protein